MEETYIRQIILPPNEVFETTPMYDAVERGIKQAGGYEVMNHRQTLCAAEVNSIFPDGGMYSYYDGEPFPRKGHPHAEAVLANNVLKRLSLQLVMPLATKEMVLPLLGFLILPYKWKINWLEKVLFNYNRLAGSLISRFYLKPRYYNPCSQELKVLVAEMLKSLGISELVAEDTGKNICTIIEYDDAYRYRVEDIFSEVTQEEVLDNPRKAVEKMMKVFVSRELAVGNGGVQDKLSSMIKLASFALLIPKVKKAFRAGMSKVVFRKLQLDEADRYYAFNKPDYNYGGKTWIERKAEHDEIRKKYIISERLKMVEQPLTIKQ